MENDFAESLIELSQLGLNLFASCVVNGLPGDLRDEFLNAGISLDEYSSLGLFAHGGRRLWENIKQPALEENHPVDTHSLKCLETFVQRVSPRARTLVFYPSDTLMIPLQRLGRFLNLSRPSLLGLDISRDYGPWFAYRVAFLSTAQLPEHKPIAFDSPCDSCAEKPCKAICPAGATGESFAMSRCADYRLSANSRCLARCLARIACPYKEEHRYTEEQIRYHMMRPGHLRRLMGYATN